MATLNDIFPNKHKFEGVCQMARLILTGFVVQNVRFDFSVSDGFQLLVIFPRAVLNGFAPYILFCKNPRWKYTEFADTCVMNSSCFLKIKMTAGENSSNGILAYDDILSANEYKYMDMTDMDHNRKRWQCSIKSSSVKATTCLSLSKRYCSIS